MTFYISRRAVFEIWFGKRPSERFDAVCAFALQSLSDIAFSENAMTCIKAVLRSLCQQIELKWRKCNRHHDRFLNNNSAWLEGEVKFPDIIYESLPSSSNNNTSSAPGRRTKPFALCCDKTKKRKLKSYVDSTSSEEIATAAEMKLREMGKKDSALIVKELLNASPKRGTALKKARKSVLNEVKTLTADHALAMIIDSSLSTHQYNIIREQANNIVPNLYPAYNAVKQAKLKCYPSDIAVTETSSKIPLQSLIEHTVQRLCVAQSEVLESIPDTCNDLHFIIKWGCDGSQQTRYKQKFAIENDSDENLFSISMVPIQLYFESSQEKKIVWQNPATSSVRYCRPIKFIFAKESAELIVKEVNAIEKEAMSLDPICVNVSNRTFFVKSELILCMIDGKVCTALTSYSSSQTCFLCGATPKQMNGTKFKDVINEKALTFGLSPLHSWIRFMECVLHISYRLELKIWQARGTEIKLKVSERKKHIQQRFKSEMGLLVDIPTHQAGNTNDGNTARRFFRNAEKSADITGVNIDLIKRFHTILETINCGFPINADAFDQYASETRNLYLKYYPWYYMPTSVHKVLCHGKVIITSCSLPIGQLSEEAQESRNKDNRKYRELFTRKTSRIDTNTDLIHRLLISSDPYIASIRHTPKRKQRNITSEVISLLSMPDVKNADDINSDSEMEGANYEC